MDQPELFQQESPETDEEGRRVTRGDGVVITDYKYRPLLETPPNLPTVPCACGYWATRLRFTDKEFIWWCRKCGNFTGHVQKRHG